MTDESGTSPAEAEETSVVETSAEGTSVEPESERSEGASEAQTDWEKRFKDTEIAFQKERQARAEWEKERAQWHEYARQHAARQAPADADPLEDAYRELQEAKAAFDPAREVAVQRKISQMERAAARNESVQEAMRAIELKRGLEEAKRFGYGDPNKLAEVHRSLTPAELALVSAHRDGKLSSILEADRKAAESRARDASVSASVTGQGVGGGRQVPGAGRGGEGDERPHVPRSIYFAFPEAVAKRKWPNAVVID